MMLGYISDKPYRRRILVQLNRTSPPRSRPGTVFHGVAAIYTRPTGPAKEDQLGALGLVLNAIAFFNTAISTGPSGACRTEARPSTTTTSNDYPPLVREHIEPHGRYSFSVPDAVRAGNFARSHQG